MPEDRTGLVFGLWLGFAIECNATWNRFHPELLKRTRFAELHQIGFRHVRLAIRPRDDEPLDCGERRPMQLVGIRTKPVKPERISATVRAFRLGEFPDQSTIAANAREENVCRGFDVRNRYFTGPCHGIPAQQFIGHEPFQIMPRNKHGFCRCILFRPSNATQR